MLGGAAPALAVPTTLVYRSKSAAGKSAAGKPAVGKTSNSADDITDTAPVSPGPSVTPSSTAGVEDSGPLLSGASTVLSLTPSAGAGSGWNGDWGIDIFSATLQSTSVPLNTKRSAPVFFPELQTISQDPIADLPTNLGGISNVSAAVKPLSTLDAKYHPVPDVAPVPDAAPVPGFSSVSGVASAPRITSVPDSGTTLTLLGIGFVSLTALRRRFAL